LIYRRYAHFLEQVVGGEEKGYTLNNLLKYESAKFNTKALYHPVKWNLRKKYQRKMDNTLYFVSCEEKKEKNNAVSKLLKPHEDEQLSEKEEEYERMHSEKILNATLDITKTELPQIKVIRLETTSSERASNLEQIANDIKLPVLDEETTQDWHAATGIFGAVIRL
jgi:hypothetical protein